MEKRWYWVYFVEGCCDICGKIEYFLIIICEDFFEKYLYFVGVYLIYYVG